MKPTSVRPTDEEITRMVRAHADTLYRICLIQLKNPADAEDAVQTVFLRLLQKAPAFASPQHERAWLIRVAVNCCRDRQRAASRRGETPLDEAADGCSAFPAASSGILEALAALPEPYRLALTLHYIEGYGVKEIAAMVGKTPSAVKMRLKKGRELLEEQYRKENS